MSNPYVIRMSWRNLLLVLAGGTLLWILPWVSWPAAGSATRTAPPRKMPVLRYLRNAGLAEGAAWSPVLIPFPTSVGFSRKAAVADASTSHPMELLKPRATTPVYLELKSGLDRGGAPRPVSLLTPAAFHPDETGAAPASGPRTGPAWHIASGLSPELEQRHFQYPEERLRASLTNQPKALSASAVVEVGARGFVQHLFLEQSSGVAEVDQLLLRVLRQGTADAGSVLASGRIKLYYWTDERPE